ncbi:two-component system, chemotaxis family, response regulator CheY [Monaibacterium marinum]|uniref:Two-component system, chemotaxis family, response regulator CheY n=1 Tax=Pontivivens marinum TaxID=1690039 RepID=A0A2C9CNH0_9RHOB|nr:response regulator [Monaibacterium marinum]SOH92757.1 two-component system, chemotaxis family, response regulator CheY [Monaibacterium marinum]
MRRILAVDDTRSMLGMLVECLQDGGHTVFTANDGVEALAALSEHCPDIVITDLNMPRMTGLEFIDAARKTPEGRLLPMLLLTTETAQELKDEARRIRATGWLCKPFDADQILGLVDQLT